MRIDFISILPDIFESVLGSSMLGIAREKGAVDFHVHDLRDWTADRHRTTDDYPFGGGHGIVMKPEPIFRAVHSVKGESPEPPTVVLVCPQGQLLDQTLVEDLAGRERLIIICGRYEGFDDRVRSLADFEVSIGDYVLTGGELPAMVIADAVTRLQPGVLASVEATQDESHSSGLLEYPQYTRPATFEGDAVPDVLLSGDHARIATWRRREALRRTAERRPDVLDRAELTDEERAFVRALRDDAVTRGE